MGRVGVTLATLGTVVTALVGLPVRPALASPSGPYLATGAYYTCALTTSHGVRCWGEGGVGQLGDGTTGTDRWSPVDVVGLPAGTATAIGAAGPGHGHSCAVTGGGVRCWGYGIHGALGNGSFPFSQPFPTNVIGLGASVTQAVSAGDYMTCALVPPEA